MRKYFDDTERAILESISKENLDMVLKKFDTIDRLSGSAGELEALRFLQDKLDEYGVPYHEYVFDSYLSDPKGATLSVLLPDGKTLDIPAKTRAFSGNCPEGVTGELVYATGKGGIDFDTAAQIDWTREQVEGKIIVSEGGGPQHMDRAMELGAIALIHVWPSKEDVIHEMTASPVWGTPTPETQRLLPTIPEVSVKNADGEKLIKMAQSGKTMVRLSACTDSGVRKLHLAVAEIPGQSDDYVLLSGHLDSWYVGITDNAVGNALCLELARLFHEHRGELKRGIRIAWWPGHSNGRYAGSTYYCDREFESLRKHCVAYINADSPGSRFGVIPLVRSTLSEKPGYFEDAVRDVAEAEPVWDFPIRAGDNSMWGAFIPFHLMLRDRPDAAHADAKVGGSGGGWWWHSEQDTYDKADLDLLVRDSRIFASFALRIMQSDLLPVDLSAMAAKMLEILHSYEANLCDAFDLSTVITKAESLRKAADRLAKAPCGDNAARNALLKSAAGRLNALMYTTVSPYCHDVAYDLKPFHNFYRVGGITRENTSPAWVVFHQTDFLRQVNRFRTEVDQVIEEIERHLSQAQ